MVKQPSMPAIMMVTGGVIIPPPPLLRKHPPILKHRGERLGLSHVTFCPFPVHFSRLRKHRGGVTKEVLEQGGGLNFLCCF